MDDPSCSLDKAEFDEALAVDASSSRRSACVRAILEAVREGYAPFVAGGTVQFTAACWMIGGVNE